MELTDFFETSILLGYYKNILSEKQREYMIDHFEMDYSLSEIAKKHNISRQAVYDNIKRGIAILKEYEEKLGSYKRDMEMKKELEELKIEHSKNTASPYVTASFGLIFVDLLTYANKDITSEEIITAVRAAERPMPCCCVR